MWYKTITDQSLNDSCTATVLGYMAQYGKVNYETEHVHDLSILGTTTLSHIHQGVAICSLIFIMHNST